MNRSWQWLLMMALVAAALGVGMPRDGRAQGMQTFSKAQIAIQTQSGQRHTLTVELASTEAQLTQGLMYRRTLAADAGMLFDFGDLRPVSMWMKNTLIPLDMLFLAKDGRIVGIAERAIPGSQEIISSPEPVKGVLEVNGGTASRLGLHAGDRVLAPAFGG